MNDPKQLQDEQPTTNPQVDPNTHLYQWLNENNYELVTDAFSEKTPFLDRKGFVLTDRPLLIVGCRIKESK